MAVECTAKLCITETLFAIIGMRGRFLFLLLGLFGKSMFQRMQSPSLLAEQQKKSQQQGWKNTHVRHDIA